MDEFEELSTGTDTQGLTGMHQIVLGRFAHPFLTWLDDNAIQITVTQNIFQKNNTRNRQCGDRIVIFIISAGPSLTV